MQTLVSISIPLYNCEAYLVRCLQSVLVQTYKNYEVILVNDCTQDNSVAIAEQFISEHQLAKTWEIVHLSENSGLSVVRNKGIELARGKYLFFLDSDDTISPDCIEKLVLISEQTGAEMSIAQLQCTQQETGETKICIEIKSQEKQIEGNLPILEAFCTGNLVSYAVNKLFIVDFLRQKKLYFVKGLFAQDELWTFHLVLKMNKIAICKDITYTYYLHKNSVIHNRGKRNFDNWQSIGEYINQAYRAEKHGARKVLILKYLTMYRNFTLVMNWKAKKNRALWEESYSNYKKLSSFGLKEYLSCKYSLSDKKTNFLNNLPTRLGFKIFKKRFGD